MEDKSPTDNKKVYHERQVKELCAMHALNNLFQSKQAFTKKEFDEICNRLSPGSFINPHRSIFGLGNYDVNVLMAALQGKGYETIWFDKRKDVDVLIMENVMGLILNTPTDYKLGFMKLPIHRKHWIAIKCLHGQYMNLDSKLDMPCPIGDEASLLTFLRSELSNGEKELLLVVNPEVYEKSLWRRDSSSGESSQSSPAPTDEEAVNDGITENTCTNNTVNGEDELNKVVHHKNHMAIPDQKNGNVETASCVPPSSNPEVAGEHDKEILNGGNGPKAKDGIS